MDPKEYYNQPSLWNRELLPEDLDKLKILETFIPTDVHTILDVGCGNGAVTNLLPERFNITGFDFSEEALKHFKHKKVLGSTEHLPFEDGSFDLVMTMDTLEHIKPDIYERTLRELERVAKKYILVICPHNEKLYERQTQCYFCETVFHIHWHLRSIHYSDLLRSFETFSPSAFTLYGGNWATGGSKFLKQIWLRDSADPFGFHGAGCPLCGKAQNEGGAKTAEQKMRSAYFRRIDHNAQSFAGPLESQVAVLYNKKDNSDNGLVIPSQESLEVRCGAAVPVRAALSVRHRYELELGDPSTTSQTTLTLPETAYTIVNRNTDWGEPVVFEGKLSRCYEDRGGLDGHALFVLPDIADEREFGVEYYDRAEEAIYVQVYDIDNGYQTLGQLDLRGSMEWKVGKFVIPEGLKHGYEGWILRFVTNKIHPVASHPISRIFAPSAPPPSETELNLSSGGIVIPLKWNVDYFTYNLILEFEGDTPPGLESAPYTVCDGVRYVLFDSGKEAEAAANKQYRLPSWLVKTKQKYNFS